MNLSEPFIREVELVKLQAKISGIQSRYYAWFTVGIAVFLGFAAIGFSQPDLLFKLIAAGGGLILLLLIDRINSTLRNKVWKEIVEDFDKIYHGYPVQMHKGKL